MNGHDSAVTLTIGQKIRLLSRCLPFIFFSMVAVAYLTVLRTVYPLKTELLAFLAIVLLVTGYTALRHLSDVVRGTAVVTDDFLKNVLGRGSQRHRRHQHRGEFERLGRLTLTSASFRQAQRGQRYRVTYSPASKIVWSLEPVA